mmetsp:Transcript_56766/g.116247  ORF Transcript_56766/g.116247 Transcript_56766/m.116247 type:complete len:92 (+) Transcript_56766:17-292(+)
MSQGAQLRVQLYAKAKELASQSSISVRLKQEDEVIRCEDFLERYVFEACPALRALKGSAYLAVNDTYVLPEQELTLRESDDLALIPPISGG